ncbi:hypothetical protein Gotur_014092 [Gossypium turneri]
MENNTVVRIWSEKTQLEKGDSLMEGYTSELWDFTYITLGYVDEAVTDSFDRLDKRVTPVLVILAETFRSLSACRSKGERRFIGCAQLLLVWSHSHFWKVDKVSYRVFSKNYSLLKELTATPRRDNITEERWIAILQNLKDEDVEWKAPWMVPDKILYRCGDFDWVPLLGILGAVGYAPLLIEIIKKEFEKRNLELGRKIEQLEEEKIQLGLDVDVQKLETDKWIKGKNKAKEDLDSLKVDYKKLHRSIRTAGLGKTSEQWRQKIQEEKTKADQWEKKFQDT